ncbi:MAG: cupin domain-containing protein [Chloroflexi bacterium]|nr:MAG: cupin domain-containing protein [Chloroflexota bacterium]
MGVIRRDDRLGGEVAKPQGGFSGDADQRTVHSQTEPRPVRVSFVRFQPGTITHWHSHGGGQVLHVVDGQGRTQSWGGEVELLGPGDTVSAAPGEKHWHGAVKGSEMTHLAVTIGEVNWQEPVDQG